MKIKEIIRNDIPKQFNEFHLIKKHWLRFKKILNNETLPPFEVLIHPSSGCNLACNWCIGEFVPIHSIDGEQVFNSSKFVRDGIPNTLKDPAKMTKIVTDLCNYEKNVNVTDIDGKTYDLTFQIENISFSGLIGEPLMSKEAVLAGMKVALSKDKRIGIFTNGILMDEKVRDVFSNIAYVLISLDAGTPETYSTTKYKGKSHGKTLFQQAIKNVIALNKMNGLVEVNGSFILYPENYHEIYEAARLAKEIGIKNFRLKQDNSGTKVLNFKQVQEANDLVLKIKSDLVDNSFSLVEIHHIGAYEEVKRDFSCCTITDLMGAIGSDGNVYPCNYHPRPNGTVYGNALSNTFKDIWEGELRSKLKKNIPSICPKVCDPFKNRSNKMLEELKKIHSTQGIKSLEKIITNI